MLLVRNPACIPRKYQPASRVFLFHNTRLLSPDRVRCFLFPIPPASYNTPDMIYLICNPTLAVSGVKLFYFHGFGFLSPCVVIAVMHLISCHHVHCICIHVRLMHPSIFPVVRFAIRHSYVLRRPLLSLFVSGC